jgi:hypothetical protein
MQARKRKEIVMQSFQKLLSPPERRAAALAAAVVGAAVLSAALLLFAESGRAPWFSAHSEPAAAAQRCQEHLASAERHRCVRQVAALAAMPLASASASRAPR